MKFDTDRPRGMLSPADRNYLLGEAEMEHEQSKRNAEARIRERVVNSIVDFNLLVHTLKKKDRRQIFDKSVDDEEFVDGVMAMLSFAYVGLKESGVEFDHVLEPAIRKSEEVYAADVLGSTVDVDIEFDVKTQVRTELDDVNARIERGDPVSPAELFSVIIGGDLSLDEVEEVVLQRGADGDSRQGQEFVERIAEFMDAEVEELPLNRVRLTTGDADALESTESSR